MTIAYNATHQTDHNAVHRIMELCTSHEFRFILKLILVAYNVVLAHAAITQHTIPAANAVVMAGLITSEVSLVSLILQVSMAKVDSKLQQNATIASIIFISVAVGLNAMAGVAVIRGIPAMSFLTTYTDLVSPMLPVIVLLMVFFSDASSDKVQRTIRQAVSDAQIASAEQKSDLAIAKSEQTARLRKQELANESTIAVQVAQNEIAELELLRAKAVREKETAQINAQITIAKNEGEVLAEVAKKATETRKAEMFNYLGSPEFVKTVKRTAKKDAMALINQASAGMQNTANTATTGNL